MQHAAIPLDSIALGRCEVLRKSLLLRPWKLLLLLLTLMILATCLSFVISIEHQKTACSICIHLCLGTAMVRGCQ